MANPKTFRCSIITPERQVLDCDATFAAFPAHDGEIGILPGRAPLLCQLGIGVMRVETEGRTARYFIDGGFAQMVNNRLTVLSEQSAASTEIDRGDADRGLQTAKLMSGSSADSLEAKRLAVARASAKLKAAS